MDRINKPRAFLSHSKIDKHFIEELAADLRKCQIDYWLDTEEIRAGKSWLKMIFEDGIPTCDIVIVYLTENSIKSKMVEKEIDATLIEQLSEKGIAFLPYVSKAALRENLRADIRSLQCKEWNNDNYHEILPSVIAEIWHSYMERTINIAVTQEKSRRLELELELKKQKEMHESSPFSPAEETDFGFIYKMMNKPIRFVLDLWEKGDVEIKPGNKRIGKEAFRVSYFESIIYYLNKGCGYFKDYHYMHEIVRILKENGFPKDTSHPNTYYGNSQIDYNIVVELRTFGLTKTAQTTGVSVITTNQESFTEKMYKFHYWLGYNNLIRDKIDVEYLGPVETKDDKQ
ncbi:MAG: toll/interleukin-1 receptor domain-containing protein [Planctomycetes bacterium]|uniref:toll/interleukin-1 receptor domain-containing protein n=1 Tax=Candidatus Wunengus sp. YC65 TaxID=3367701 RepID=UPI001D9F840F|nr:toll/interleukin-1 receptor domain-containing protein [Planctomycetota bacterium]